MNIMQRIEPRITDRKQGNWPLKTLRLTRRDYHDLLKSLDEAGLLTNKTRAKHKDTPSRSFMGVPIEIMET